MSYLVLARKYRPQNFESLVGQNHITDLLGKSIESKRLAHAFLFCGPRGIGKTSTARILAKSLNCQEGPTLKPCGVCSACQEITSGNSFDVIEIDGASNRGIDEIRALRENVKFAPAYGRYKIYIVDEVHMLTGEAFNALLKTLEEPPEHVKFIFATTEANKVPATILSRCQRFDFKRIGVDTIMKNLSGICAQEKLTIEESALFAIAKAAQGSMRDALSILDQLSALGAEGIKSKDVYSMLGIVETELLFNLTDALIAKDCPTTFNVFNDIVERGKDIKQLGKDLIEHFRNLMIVKIGGPTLTHMVDYPAAVKQRLDVQSQKITIPAVLKAMDVLIETQEVARVMETLRTPLELAFAKLCFNTVTPQATAMTTEDVKPAAPILQAAQSAKMTSTQGLNRIPSTVVATDAAPANASVPAGKISLEELRLQWNVITHSVSKLKMSMATYLQDGFPSSYKDGKLVIGFTNDHSFAMEFVGAKDNLIIIEKVISERFNTPVGVSVRIDDGATKKVEAPVVKNVLEMFGGEVVKEWPNA